MPLLEVCLIDGNPISNYIGNILKKPDAIVWLRTVRQKHVSSNIESVLSTQMKVECENREVNQGDIQSFVKVCEDIIRDYPQYDIALNASGGTRIQALIAAEIFLSAGKEVFIIDTEHSRLIDLKTKESKSFHAALTVNEYIGLYGVKVLSGTRFDPEIGKRSGLTYFLGNNIEKVVPFIDELRIEWNEMGEKKQSKQWKLSNKFIKFTVTYDSEKDLMRFRYGQPENMKMYEMKENYYHYIFNGGWLRELVFLRVHRAQYDDVRLDVRLDRNALSLDPKAETMIDIAMMRGCKFYVFQCFSYPVTRESFIALNAITHTIKFLNAEGYIFVSHKPNRSFIETAKDSGLRIISGKYIANFSI